ncbi:sporulation initiation factor Spo0A C-terminal domain-containing protein [Bacillus sp. ISL-7]|uniref:sporulation initiation factor Spo0A C-terminal domain-containing protein n=1 Tax=Bacillus sp. ISL-7 TaxID=2819136 RepID=UPI001BE8D375|nr:sporulation initiation factor Spo0A C-terminal domain-containing protein [Bacillus sp. ISL-7]MBT2735172.1 sporulation initiation factor Spo0A C-terminal domain-containing protein [Bacillus sp. ISL-7]
MSEILLEVLKLRKEVAELKSIVQEIAGSRNKLSYQDNEIGIEGKITAFLHDIKLPTKLLGYSYLKVAIKEVYEDPDLIGTFSTVLYPNIANKFKTTPSRVERAIRHGIEASYKKNLLHPFYSANFNSRPTNADFIAIIADEFLMKEKYKSEVI